jgi:predicted KAP-like P-loop ATPase
MIRLVRKALVERAAKESSSFVFAEFNAWLYQGYEDARAALMEVIASALAEEAEKRETGVDKAKDFLRRVKWLRLAKVAGTVVAAAAGIPPLALAGETLKLQPRSTNASTDSGFSSPSATSSRCLTSRIARSLMGHFR